MAKQGMKRPEVTHLHPRNTQDPVPILQSKAKSGKEKANPIVAGTSGPSEKLWHTERPIPEDAYGTINTDLGRDNLENDIPDADLQDI